MLTHDETVSLALASRVLRAAPAVEIDPPDTLGAQENVTDGGFENWASATDLTSWGEIISAGNTVNRESVEKRTGTYCLRFDKTANGGLQAYQLHCRFRPGAWYHLTGWCKASAPGGARVNIAQDGSAGPGGTVRADGYPSTSGALPTFPTSTTYERLSLWFFIGAPNGTTPYSITDIWTVYLTDPDGGTYPRATYLDDVSILGPYPRPQLRYGTRAMTWQGDTYAARLLSVGRRSDSMALVQSKLDVELGHADRALRSYLADPDAFDGAKVRARVILLDSALAPDESTSLVFWRGVARRPRAGSDLKLVLPCVGMLDPRKSPIPGRNCTGYCQVRRFADGVDCGYTTTTTTTNANTGTASTGPITVSSGANLANGQKIRIFPTNWAPTATEVTIVSGGGTGSITVDTAINWNTGWLVAYTQCDREWTSCEKRGRTHEYQGFRAVRLLQRQVAFNDVAYQKARRAKLLGSMFWPSPAQAAATVLLTESVFADATKAVPILIGRRWIEGLVIEEARQVAGAGSQSLNVRVIALAEGEIDSIVRAKIDDADFAHVVAGGGLTHGYYWRPGTLGITGTEDIADYQADPNTKQRPQNTDYVTATGTPLSRLAYAIAEIGTQAEQDTAGRLTWDVKGAKLQKYLADASLDGSPVWTPNPIWAAVWLVSTRRLGLDLGVAELDMAVHKAEADHCDAVIASNLAKTTTTGSGTGTDIPVASVEGFFRGQAVDVGGDTGKTIDVIVDERTIRLTASITYANGETVQGYVSRWEAHWYHEDQSDDAIGALRDLLTSCRGYVTQDHASGKIQVRSERNHVTDQLAGLGLVDSWSGGAPVGWTKVETGGTVTQETTVVHTASVGGSAAKLARTGAGDLYIAREQTGLVPGAWYLLSLWIRCATDDGYGFSNALHVRVEKGTAVWDGAQSPPRWKDPADASDMSLVVHGRKNEWLQVLLPFQWRHAYATTDTVRIEVRHGGASVGTANLYVDDGYLYGPLAGYFRDTDDDWPEAEHLANGGLDTWSAGAPTGWAKVVTHGTIAQENTTKKAGASSAKFVKTSAGDGLYLEQQYVDGLLPGRTYELRFWHYLAAGTAAAAAAGSPRVRLVDLTTGKYWQPGGTWDAAATFLTLGTIVPQATAARPDQRGTWTRRRVRFTIDAAHEVYDCVTLQAFGNNADGVTEYYDGFEMIGPLDRVPIRQPGMGIIRGTFRPLEVDDDARDANRASVEFQNEDTNGSSDAVAADDFGAQRVAGRQKALSVRAPAVGHGDHASRLADYHLRRARDLGPGASCDLGWCGLLLQPGDVVAMRHEQPGWVGALRRVTKPEIYPTADRRRFVSHVETEDYIEAIYTGVAKAPGQSFVVSVPTLALTVDGVTVDGVLIGSLSGFKLTWAFSSQQVGQAAFSVHASTTNGFAPTSATKIGSTEKNHWVYFPKPGDKGQTWYFKVVATLPHREPVTSNQGSAQIDVVADPTDTQYVPGGNLIYGGDCNKAALWTGTAPTYSPVTPTTNAAVAGGGYATPANAYDGDSTTRATATMPVGPVSEKSHQWGLPGTTSGVKGYWTVTHAMGGGGGSGSQYFFYSLDSGSTWTPMPFWSTLTKQTHDGPVIQGDRDKIKVKSSTFGANGWIGSTYEVVWNELGAGVFSQISGGVATMRGNGTTTYGELQRPFPGEGGVDSYTVPAGTSWVLGLMARLIDGSSTSQPVLIQLLDLNTGTYTTIARVEAADVIATMRAYAWNWIAPAKMESRFKVVVRTLGDKIVEWDKVRIWEGDKITAFGLHVDEVNQVPDWSKGSPDAFPVGQWDFSGGNAWSAAKITTVS